MYYVVYVCMSVCVYVKAGSGSPGLGSPGHPGHVFGRVRSGWVTGHGFN